MCVRVCAGVCPVHLVLVTFQSNASKCLGLPLWQVDLPVGVVGDMPMYEAVHVRVVEGSFRPSRRDDGKSRPLGLSPTLANTICTCGVAHVCPMSRLVVPMSDDLQRGGRCGLPIAIFLS